MQPRIPVAAALLSMLAAAAGAGPRDHPFPGAAEAARAVSQAATPSGLRQAKRFMLRGGYVAAGVSLRNRGAGTIDIETIPGAQAEAAYLYFTILDHTDPMQALVDVGGQLGVLSFEGQVKYLNASNDPITRVGRDLSPCWPAEFSFSYRLDVTRHLRRQGVWPAQVTLSGFPTGDTSGDPWINGSRRPMIEGATLVIVYRLASAPLTEVAIYDGNSLYKAAAVDTAVAVHPEPRPRGFRTTFIGADGQSIAGPFSLVDGRDVGLPWDGADPPTPGLSMGNLWDTLTAEGQPLERKAQLVTAGLAAGSGVYDCVVWVAQIVAVEQDDDSGCSAGFFFGADTNVNDATGDGRVTIKDFPNELSTPTCHGPQHRRVFYAGRLGSVPLPGIPWTCFIQDVGTPQGNEASCNFDAEAAHVASPQRSYAYWWLLGPPRCPGGNCPLPPDRSDCDGLTAVTVPGVADADQGYARFGACQAEMLYQQARRYSVAVGGNVLFADIEDPPAGQSTVWNACPSGCSANRAVLQGFLWRVEQRGMVPGVYTTSEFWRVKFESNGDSRYPWNPGVPFVVWLAADRATCDEQRDRGLQCFPNTVLGGMRPVIWQYVEADAPTCTSDYDVLTQDPTYDPDENPRFFKPGLRPEPAWGPDPYVVFTRERELSLPQSQLKCWIWP